MQHCSKGRITSAIISVPQVERQELKGKITLKVISVPQNRDKNLKGRFIQVHAQSRTIFFCIAMKDLYLYIGTNCEFWNFFALSCQHHLMIFPLAIPWCHVSILFLVILGFFISCPVREIGIISGDLCRKVHEALQIRLSQPSTAQIQASPSPLLTIPCRRACKLQRGFIWTFVDFRLHRCGGSRCREIWAN